MRSDVTSVEGDAEDAQTRMTLLQDSNPLSALKAAFLERSHTHCLRPVHLPWHYNSGLEWLQQTP